MVKKIIKVLRQLIKFFRKKPKITDISPPENTKVMQRIVTPLLPEIKESGNAVYLTDKHIKLKYADHKRLKQKRKNKLKVKH